MLSLSKSNALFLGLIISASAYASDEHKAYVQFNGGVAFPRSFSEGTERCDSFFGCSSFSYKEHANTGYAAGVAIGYHLTDSFRLEGEAMYQSNDLDHFSYSSKTPFGEFKTSGSLAGERERTAFLLNAYYDFKNSTPFTPYVTAGVGGYHLNIKSSRFNPRPSRENDLDFAWQVGAGLNYRLNDRVSFDLKYRYFSGADAELSFPPLTSNTGQPIRNITELYEVGDHQVMAGIRVGF